MREAGPEVEPNEPGLPEMALTMLRLLTGWACVAVGLLDLAMGLTDPRYLLFHGALLAGGLILLALGHLPKRPGLPGYLAGGAVTVLGLLVSALPGTSSAFCCQSDHPRRHGFPFTAVAAGAGLDFWHALIDLIFWACAGLVALVLVTLVTPARRVAEERPAEPVAHAEGRAEVADDENVGGLP